MCLNQKTNHLWGSKTCTKTAEYKLFKYWLKSKESVSLCVYILENNWIYICKYTKSIQNEGNDTKVH